MKKSGLIFSVIFVLLGTGCFKHRGPPHRPVTAKTLAEAVTMQATVECVNLSGQSVAVLPRELSSMPKLAMLWLREAQGLTSLAGLSELTSLRRLDLSSTKLENVPAEVFALKDLEHLYLADNGIAALPALIGGMTGLTYLNLDSNQLAGVPPEIGKLTELRWLRLNENKLSTLPQELAALVRLQRIYLRQNQFAVVPESLKELTLLEDISLSGNVISEIPGWMTELPKLRQVEFDGCKTITKLPDQLDGWKNLQVLSLVGCPLPDEEKARIRAALPKVHVAF